MRRWVFVVSIIGIVLGLATSHQANGSALTVHTIYLPHVNTVLQPSPIKKNRSCGTLEFAPVGPLPTATPIPTATAVLSDTEGQEYINLWPQRLAQVTMQTAPTQAVIAVFGDSWVENQRITTPLTTSLKEHYGDGGAGYIGIGRNSGAPDVDGTTYQRTGVWKDCDQTTGSRGVTIADATSKDIANPGTVTITSIATSFTIHYLVQPGGGEFRYRVDDGGWQTVATTGAYQKTGLAYVSDLAPESHTLTIEVSVAGSVGVTLMGVDSRIEHQGGVRLHRLGNGSLTTTQAASVDLRIWREQIAALAPDIVIVLLGTNDMNEGSDPAIVGFELMTLVRSIRAAVPDVDIVLAAPSDNGINGRPYTIPEYNDTIRYVARTMKTGFFDGYVLFGPFQKAYNQGYYKDILHLSRRGGALYAETLRERLLSER